MKTFAELLVELSRNEVKYILVGGLVIYVAILASLMMLILLLSTLKLMLIY